MSCKLESIENLLRIRVRSRNIQPHLLKIAFFCHCAPNFEYVQHSQNFAPEQDMSNSNFCTAAVLSSDYAATSAQHVHRGLLEKYARAFET